MQNTEGVYFMRQKLPIDNFASIFLCFYNKAAYFRS